MNENLFSHSECSSAKLIFHVLMPVGSTVEFLLKGQCHEDFAVLGQFWAKITTLSLCS